jgi:WD40 repeat protein
MGRTKHELDGHKHRVKCLVLIKENLLISSGVTDKTLKVWDITTNQCIKSLQDEEHITAITILPNGNIATNSDFYIKIRNIKEDFNCTKIIKLERCDSYIRLFMLSNDIVACFCSDKDELDWLLILDMNKEFDCIPKISEEGFGNDSRIKIRNVLDYEHFKTLEDHTKWVSALLFVKKYNIMLSGSLDTIRAWCTISYQCCRIIDLSIGVESLLLLPNGCFASGSSEGVIQIWDISNYECYNSIESQSNWISSLILTEDKRIISVSPYDNTIVICDI